MEAGKIELVRVRLVLLLGDGFVDGEGVGFCIGQP